MARIGWYYLHQNGSLIYKREFDDTVADLRESDLVRAIWPMDPADREGAGRRVEESGFRGVVQIVVGWFCAYASCSP